MTNRRDALGLAAFGAAAAMTAGEGQANAAPFTGLDALARAKGMIGFGSCIGDGTPINRINSFNDEGVQNIHRRECGIVVPSNALKWTAIRPNPQDFNFYEGDKVVAWGEANHMKVRGHNLLWLRPDRNPDWMQTMDFGARPAAAAEKMLRDHITTVCKRYGNRIYTWDVVNEAIDPFTGNVRDMMFTKYLGPAAVDIAFDAARNALPADCALVYNDYMGWNDASAKHRDGVLKLLDHMKSQKLKVDVLGVQAHIGAGLIGFVMGDLKFDAAQQAAFRQFLDSAVGMGHHLAITEFDVSEDGTPADIAQRDRILADLTRRYMDFMLGYRQMDYVMCWGMVDHYSWLQSRNLRPDGMLKRPTPYDPNYAPKPMREAFAAALRAMAPHG
jgi:endo-1,4-beta-xylanase